MDFSSQQNQYPYHSSQSYNPSRFQANDRQSYYSNYQYQQDTHQQKQQLQQQQQQYHHQQQQQYQQPQQQYSSYYTPNYSNSYPPQHPQTHQQWHHQEPPIYPPGVSCQPSSASREQAHFQLPNQQNAYYLPQRTDRHGLGLNPEAVAALVQLTQLAGSVGAKERLTGGLHGQSWYPRAEGFRPVIGGPGIYTCPGLGSGAFPGHGPGPCGLVSHGGQSLDKAGGRRGGGHSKGGGRGKFSNSAGVARCELCKVDCNRMDLKQHESGKRHRRNLKKLEANENRTVTDFQNVQKPSVDLKPGTTMKHDNLLVEEDSKQKPPENIPVDTVPSENKLETEQKINNAQQADPPKDANRDLLAKKPMMNQSGNQKCGVKRKTLGGRGKKKKVSKAKRQVIEPSKSVVIPLMCDLCNVKCGTREILRHHLLGREHKSQLKCFEGHHPIYGRLGLQALYPPNPVTKSLYHSQGALNGAQVSDPIAGASLLPQNDNAAPSATGVSMN